LRVDKQVQALGETGLPTIVGLAETKGDESDVVIPAWLAERVQGLTTTAKPDGVRESLRRAGARVGIALEGPQSHPRRHCSCDGRPVGACVNDREH